MKIWIIFCTDYHCGETQGVAVHGVYNTSNAAIGELSILEDISWGDDDPYFHIEEHDVKETS